MNEDKTILSKVGSASRKYSTEKPITPKRQTIKTTSQNPLKMQSL